MWNIRRSIVERTEPASAVPGHRRPFVPEWRIEPAREKPPGRATIRGRVARLLLVPLAAILLLLGDLVIKEIDEYAAADGATATTELAMSAQSLSHQLQLERDLTALVLAGGVRWRGDLAGQRLRVDTARTALSGLRDAEGPGPEAVYTTVAQLEELGRLRVEVDTGRVGRQSAVQSYTDRIAALNRLDIGLDAPFPDPDPELRRGLAAMQALSDAKEATSAARGLLGAAYVRGLFEDGERARLAALFAVRRVALADAGRYVSAPVRDRLERAITGADADAAAEQAVTDGSPKGDTDGWLRVTTALLDELSTAQSLVADGIRARTDDLREEATVDLAGLGAVILLALIGALLLGRSAATGITRPLARLVSEADSAAARRLPAAVARLQDGTGTEPPPPVVVAGNAGAEIRSVADALNRLQSSAYALAAEQAVLRRNTTDSMANLGRRNQNLLRRQLSFITQLEREETDPAGLANLFELDHLATRMRRNAESLLVLVGEATPRSWSRSLPMSDVLRAAIAEVEDYRRVSLRRIDDAFTAGAYVADLAHMIAELVENGLTFSPPDFDVEVHGRWVDDGSYLIAIVDQGVGMSAEELARANARLAGTESFTVAPTKFLGHYVVGHLAAKLGVRVEICQSPVTGTTARVRLPARLLTPGPETPAATTYSIEALEVPPPAPDAAVTENGLVKRVRRAQRAAVPVARTADERPVPADIGATMTALRRGMRLGASSTIRPEENGNLR
ncbi:signal transduction histidine kinase [Catenuloplanes nepalensis]|uniref:histidine kinase n=1 Tax=Catenuloplanes nepalensis TaxID=587533 RepID=A0ABT9N3M3_9ACTN|nr:nitrate- and nitrite sensing domain-containing protein [Catenuloplanes nepalensis]MDP9798150.1 signal transduction histidine kinase [Catenuloplanes nepalensis]